MKKKYFRPVTESDSEIEFDTILAGSYIQNDEGNAKAMFFDYEDMEVSSTSTNSDVYENVWDEE